MVCCAVLVIFAICRGFAKPRAHHTPLNYGTARSALTVDGEDGSW